jgi:ornithine cyclodeaminase
MVKIVELDQIKEILTRVNIIQAIEDGFVAYSQGKVIVPPVGEMLFDDPPGDCHIKYGFIKDDDYYVIKIAQGFYDNPKIGLPSFDGINLVFNQKTGQTEAILLDRGHLTNERTAAAGAVVAKYLAPKNVRKIGIVGTGAQGKLQLSYLGKILECRDVLAWDLYQDNLNPYKIEMEQKGFNVETTLNINDITSQCNYIVTCTPSKKPLIMAEKVKKGTHITGMGSDTSEKQELDSEILNIANCVVVDSIFQSETRGESYKAMENGKITKDKLIELGNLIQNPKLGRKNDNEITVADLTGVAVQDIQISKAVLKGIK